MEDKCLYAECLTSPQFRAGILSKLTFSWLIPLFKKGLKSNLTLSDLYEVRPEDESSVLGDLLEREWEDALVQSRSKTKDKIISLTNCFIKIFGKQHCFITFLCFLSECVFKVFQPICLYYLIKYLDGSLKDTLGYIAATGLIASTFLNVVSYHLESFKVCCLGMQIRIATCSLMYRKILKNLRFSSDVTTPGQLINMMSNDVNRLEQAPLFLRYLVVATVQLIITTLMLCYYIGLSSLIAVAVFILMVPIQGIFGKCFGKLRSKSAVMTDERVRYMSEIISGIKVIKTYGWEDAFINIINNLRKKEISIIRQAAILKSINGSMSHYMTKVLLVVTVVLYAKLGNEVTSEEVFLAASIYNVIRISAMILSPLGIANLAEGLISARRIQDFLTKIPKPLDSACKTRPSQNISIELSNLCASWNPASGSVSLNNISIQGKAGDVIAIVGRTGSGKTSLLMSLLGEMPIISGFLKMEGSVAFCSQEAFIFKSSVRQNILMGQDYEQTFYEQVVKAACLKSDFQLFAQGDATTVGDRGVSLSGGQKARVSLARTLYQNSNIVLLDDPLSAVDAKVSHDIFHSCVKGFLRDKLVILITHQQQYLPFVTKIYMMEQGGIKCSGTYQELLEQGIDFCSLEESNEPEAISALTLSHSHHHNDDIEFLQKKDSREDEKAITGTVSYRVYWRYLSAGSTWLTFTGFIIVLLLSQAAYGASDVWTNIWVKIQEDFKVTYSSPLGLSLDQSHLIFGGLVLATAVLYTAKSVWFYLICMNASIQLHDNMFRSVVNSPMTFFDHNSAGTILNRFSKDTGLIDDMLPMTFDDTLTILLMSLVTMAVITWTNYWITIPSLFLMIGISTSRWFYLKTARDIKRLEGISRSPVFSHITSTIQGITTIRSSTHLQKFLQEFDTHQNLHTASWYLFLATSRWLGIILDLALAIYLTFSVVVFVALRSTSSGSDLGLAISLILTLGSFCQWGVRQSAELENQMTSVERVKEYGDLPTEDRTIHKHKQIAIISTHELLSEKRPCWPSRGEIVFKNVSLYYDNKAIPVLKNLNFLIHPGEKIGIVGRTGAGKSSLLTTLFRLSEPTGNIIIDGVDTKSIDLHSLRTSISIIPQDPVFFTGTLRMNLDPFSQYSDADIWNVLESVHLRPTVKCFVSGLQHPVQDGGSNFSVGERQLLCLARALLMNNRIIVLDEATASVDKTTDDLIQSTIRRTFVDATVLTIAHRLNTVMDSDRIMLLDAGTIQEFDHPHLLLQQNGLFGQLVDRLGPANSKLLRDIAQKNYLRLKETL